MTKETEELVSQVRELLAELKEIDNGIKTRVKELKELMTKNEHLKYII